MPKTITLQLTEEQAKALHTEMAIRELWLESHIMELRTKKFFDSYEKVKTKLRHLEEIQVMLERQGIHG